jgi:hypothetical protein
MAFKFEVPDDEVKEYREWRKEHDKVCQTKDVGAIGGGFTFSFTQTALGCITKVKCSCGKELDLTHSEEW